LFDIIDMSGKLDPTLGLPLSEASGIDRRGIPGIGGTTRDESYGVSLFLRKARRLDKLVNSFLFQQPSHKQHAGSPVTSGHIVWRRCESLQVDARTVGQHGSRSEMKRPA
jgi:hypothetical protein